MRAQAGLRDPVTGFVYPDRWVAACSPENREDVAAGRAVLTATGAVLRRGYTTGTTAAAACKASVLSLSGSVEHVTVLLPCALRATLPVRAANGEAAAVKDPGDYPGDVTGGLEFIAHAAPRGTGPSLIAGEGIGRFIRETPRYGRGDPAISAPAYAAILGAIEEAMRDAALTGVQVTLTVPRGAETARSTLNPHMGVAGGISVLGSTGFVEPWDDHLADSALARVAAADRIVLTTGRLGLRYSRLLFPDHEVVLVGARIADAIAAAKNRPVILCGLPGLILRHITPEICEGTGYATVEEFSTDPAFSSIIREILREYRIRAPNVRVVLVDRAGRRMEEIP
ncbi:MAG: cobalt-precorrin-6A synthase [Methanoculleus sp. SDB]|nr:MAG: cobalt-precorrin-6A synthase [Methanoculleus sp. SDB]